MLEKLATKDHSQKQAGNSLVPRLLFFQKRFVFVGGGSTDVANPCQFTDVKLPVLMCGVVAKKGGGNVLFTHLRTPDLPSLCSGIAHILHTAPFPTKVRIAIWNHSFR